MENNALNKDNGGKAFKQNMESDNLNDGGNDLTKTKKKKNIFLSLEINQKYLLIKSNGILMKKIKYWILILNYFFLKIIKFLIVFNLILNKLFKKI